MPVAKKMSVKLFDYTQQSCTSVLLTLCKNTLQTPPDGKKTLFQELAEEDSELRLMTETFINNLTTLLGAQTKHSNKILESLISEANHNGMREVGNKKVRNIAEQLITREDVPHDAVAECTLLFIKDMLLWLDFTDGLAFDLLKAWQEYEDIVYLTRSTYRDHFMHQFNVFLLGCLFLNKVYGNVEKKHWYTLGDKKPRKKRLLRRWFLASAFHDIGYPAETLSDLRETLHNKFFNKIPNYGVKPIVMCEFEADVNLAKLIEPISKLHLYTEDLDFTDMFSTSKSEDHPANDIVLKELNTLFLDEIRQTHDHGVTGAIFFLKTALIDMREMVKTPKSDKTVRHEPVADLISDILVATTAIAGHTLRANTYPGFTVDFDARPIGALLNFCDDLQEWDRKPNDHDWALRRSTPIVIEEETPDVLLFRFKNDSGNDPGAINAQKHLLNSLDHLLEQNLSDEAKVFYKTIKVTGFSCGRTFVAKRCDSRSKIGRYETMRRDSHDDNAKPTCNKDIGKHLGCLHCAYGSRKHLPQESENA